MRPSIQELCTNFWAEENSELQELEAKAVRKIERVRERYKKAHPSVVINANAKPIEEPKGWATKSKVEPSNEPKPRKKRGHYRERLYKNSTDFQLLAIEILAKNGIWEKFETRRIFLITNKNPQKQAQAQAIAEHFNKKLRVILKELL